MNSPRKLTVYDLAKHFGLTVEFRSDLPPTVQGFLAPGKDPQFIVINSNQPAVEQRFSVAHEIGHALYHRGHRRPLHRLWHLSQQFRPGPMAKILHQWRLAFAILFNTERQADFWAMSALISIGDKDALENHLKRHPKRIVVLLLLEFVFILKFLPRFIFTKLLRPLILRLNLQ